MARIGRRISVQLNDQLYDRVQGLKHGFRSPVMESLIKLALDAIDEDGDIMIGALIAGEYKLVRHERVRGE